MDTRGGGSATSPFRGAARTNPAIPESKASKTTEETLLLRFGPSVGWLKASIAVPTADGLRGSRVPLRGFAPQHGGVRGSPRWKCPKRRRRLSSVVLDGLLAACPRPSPSSPAMDSRGGVFPPLRASYPTTGGSSDLGIGSVQNGGGHSPPSFCTLRGPLRTVHRLLARRWTSRERVPFPARFGSRRGGRGRSTREYGAEPRGRLLPAVLYRVQTRWALHRGGGPAFLPFRRQYCIKYWQVQNSQIRGRGPGSRCFHAFNGVERAKYLRKEKQRARE